MRIIFTTHAKERMALRGISVEEVGTALLKPDKTGIGYGGKSIVYKKIKKGTMKVVFAQKKNTCVIVSVIWE